MPERWLRLIRDGKDIGYEYVVEEVAAGLPHKGTAPVEHGDNDTGIRVGVHTRHVPRPRAGGGCRIVVVGGDG